MNLRRNKSTNINTLLTRRLEMKDYLKTLKQEKPNCFFIGIAVLLTLTLCLSSCSKNQKTQHQTYTSDAAKAQLTFPENSSAILYVNQRLDFSAELPLDWIISCWTMRWMCRAAAEKRRSFLSSTSDAQTASRSKPSASISCGEWRPPS